VSRIAQSSRVSLSAIEAREAILMLIDLCPRFVELRTAQGQTWVHAGASVNLREAKDIIRAELAKA